MGMEPPLKIMATVLLATLSLVSVPATAYIGPGTGLSAIGSLFALIAAILVAIVGFMWYPLKRLLRSKQVAEQADGSQEEGAPQETNPHIVEQDASRP